MRSTNRCPQCGGDNIRLDGRDLRIARQRYECGDCGKKIANWETVELEQSGASRSNIWLLPEVRIALERYAAEHNCGLSRAANEIIGRYKPAQKAHSQEK